MHYGRPRRRETTTSALHRRAAAGARGRDCHTTHDIGSSNYVILTTFPCSGRIPSCYRPDVSSARVSTPQRLMRVVFPRSRFEV